MDIGYLNVLEHGGSGWKKRWVVSIRKIIIPQYLEFNLTFVNILDGSSAIRIDIPIRKGSC